MTDQTRIQDFVYGKTTYVVEKFAETGDTLKVKYILRGPRGAEYGLIPNQPRPEYLFAINARNFVKGTPFEGRWFKVETDGAGERLVLA